MSIPDLLIHRRRTFSCSQTPAAFHFSVHQPVVRKFLHIPAVASTDPDDRPADIPFFRRSHCRQIEKPLSGNVLVRIVQLVTLFRTVGSCAVFQKRTPHIIPLSAGTQTGPPDPACSVLLFRFSEDCQLPEGTPRQVMPQPLRCGFPPHTAAASGCTVQQAPFENLPLRPAGTPA